MMNNQEGFSRSKHNDQKIVDFFNKMNGNGLSHVGTRHEDTCLKIDVWLDMCGKLVPVDTKCEDTRPITKMWYEASVKGRRCEKVLYCFSQALVMKFDERSGELKKRIAPPEKFKRCFFVDVEWLDKFAEENRDKWYAGCESGKDLVDFSILDVPREHVMEVDLSGAGLV